MNKNQLLALTVTLLLLLWATPAGTQTRGEGSDPMIRQLEGLNRSLGRLVILLERSLDNQHVDILLKRIELKERRMVPLEGELRRAEREVQEHDARMRMLRGELEAQEETRQEAVRNGREDEARTIHEALEQLRRYLEEQDEESATLRERVRRLEDDLMEGRDAIEILEEMLREKIG